MRLFLLTASFLLIINYEAMKNIICIITIICVCVNISCETVKKEDSIKDYPTIKLDLSNEPVFIKSDSLLGEKVIIPLETTDESIIGEINKLEIVHDTLYILDDDQDIIFLFDKTGKYITRIADIGRGPEEYLRIDDFHIDGDIIYVVAGGNQKVFCYDLQGKFLSSFSTEFSANRIATDSNYIYVYYNFSHHENYNVATYNKKDYTLHQRYKYYPPQQAGTGYGARAWTGCGNEVYASFPYGYNIYQLFPDTCKIIAAYDFGEKNMFPKEWSTFSPRQQQEFVKNKGGAMGLAIASDVTDLFVTPNRLVFSFIYKNLKHNVLVNRGTKKIHFGVFKASSIYYWNIMSSIVGLGDDYLVISSSASDLLRSLPYMPDDALEQGLNIKEDDNPCLYFYKFKD